jgi:proton glutamate symport protein
MKVKLHALILIGLALGVILGLVFGPQARVLEPIGTIFLRLILMIVVPLVLVSLMLGTASLGDVRKLSRVGFKTILYFMVTTVAAIALGLFLAGAAKPGRGVSPSIKQELLKDYGARAEDKLQALAAKPGAVDILVNIIPTNPIKALAEGDMLQVIFLALVFGLALTLIPEQRAGPVLRVLEGINEAVMKVIRLAMLLAPLGVMALIASAIGQFGVGVLLSLLKFSLVVVAGLVLYAVVLIGLVVLLLGRVDPRRFFRATKNAIVVAFSTSSSSASLPVAMDCVADLGVRREYASFVLPLGTTIKAGTALYQAAAVVFIAQVFGQSLTFSDQVVILLMTTLATIGAAGVPSAGIVTLAMIMNQVNVPLEGIALILGVDRFLDMCRTTANIIGNMAGALVVQASEKDKT